MGTIGRKDLWIPAECIAGAEKMVGRMMHLDVDDLPMKFVKPFEETRKVALENFTMRSVFASWPVATVEAEGIRLAGGEWIGSSLLAERFAGARELVFTVTALFGYEEADAAEPNMFRKLLLDSWGTAFVECANIYAEAYIARMLEEEGLFTTHSFSPGQNDIPLELQTTIFRLLQPGDIGVALSDKCMMDPKKSISGIFAVREEEDKERVRPCDLCERRETCPNAYASGREK